MSQTFVYKNVDNLERKAELYPVERQHAPLIIYIHGGGLIWGTRKDINQQQLERYHQAGFHVLSIAYSLAPESKLPAITEDIKDALCWVKTQAPAYFDFDQNNIAVIGHSAGAFLALLSGTFEMKPKVIVSFYGYGDISADWLQNPNPSYQNRTKVSKGLAKQLIQTSPITESSIEKRYAIYLHGRQQGTWWHDLTNHPDQDLKTFSPINDVNGDYPPTLLLHGDQDEDVPYEQSQQFKQKLDQAGVTNQLITIKGGKHTFDAHMSDPQVTHAFEDVIAFLQRYMSE